MRQRKTEALFKFLVGVVKFRIERIIDEIRVRENILEIDGDGHSGCVQFNIYLEKFKLSQHVAIEINKFEIHVGKLANGVKYIEQNYRSGCDHSRKTVREENKSRLNTCCWGQEEESPHC